MSEQRSSSAVRNLRSLFENKHGDAASSEPRGRSPGGLAAGGDSEIGGLQRTSKVRASFVSVEPAPTMAALQPSESNTGRRGSFGEADGSMDLKKTISQEPAGSETAVSSVAATPNLKPKADVPGTPAEEKEAENPDKHLMGEQEEPMDMKPADPASGEAVSGGQALPPVAEDLRKSQRGTSETAKAVGRKPMVNGTSKPAAISTKAPSKPAAGTVKSPASAKTPTSSTSALKSTKHESPKAAPAKAPLKKPSRSSLTAPTAASMARSGPADKAGGSAASKAKPRETTKPVSLPSHLTAPTASSRAKHEPEGQTKPGTTSTRPSTTSKPKPSTTSTAKPARSSLVPNQRPGSRTSQTSHARRSVAPADGSFLERMMKPTTASASKTHEKTEVKSPPRQKNSAKPTANGTVAKSASGEKKMAEKKRTSHESSSRPAAPMPSEVPVQQPKAEAAVGAPGEAPAAQTIEEAAPEPAVASSPLASKSAPQEPAAVPEPATTAPEDPTPTATEPIAEVPKAAEPATGNETPQAAGETATSAALEATPAGLGSEETIR